MSNQPPHRSFHREALQERAGDVPVHEYLVEQANLRGFRGAWTANPPGRPLDPALTLEEIVVGLCCPHAPAEARIFKLVVRILQSGDLEGQHLAILARRERADYVLFWLFSLVPDPERNEPLKKLAARFREPPRGYRPLDYDYDPRRLIRRPWRREDRWPKRHC